jgi:hypothetical protein
MEKIERRIRKLKFSFFIFLFFLAPFYGSAQNKSNVQMGFYVEDLFGLDYHNSKYQIILWFWVNAPEKIDFERNLDLSFCSDLNISYISYETNEDSSYFHSECKITATVLNSFNVENYPFDRQKIKLRLDLLQFSVSDFDKYSFSLDTNSIIRPEYIHGWSVDADSTKVQYSNTDFNSTFGNYFTEKSTFIFPGLDLELYLFRDSWNLFLKSFLTLFVSIILASISLFYPHQNSEEKIGLIVGSLFTTVGNKYVTDENLPSTNFNLSDKIHILTIILITLIAIFAIIEQRFKFKNNWRLDWIMFFGILFFYFLFVSIFTGHSMN